MDPHAPFQDRRHDCVSGWNDVFLAQELEDRIVAGFEGAGKRGRVDGGPDRRLAEISYEGGSVRVGAAVGDVVDAETGVSRQGKDVSRGIDG